MHTHFHQHHLQRSVKTSPVRRSPYLLRPRRNITPMADYEAANEQIRKDNEDLYLQLGDMAAVNNNEVNIIRNDIQNLNKRFDDIERQLAYLIEMVTTFTIQGSYRNQKVEPQSHASLIPPSVLPYERQQMPQSPQNCFDIAEHQDQSAPKGNTLKSPGDDPNTCWSKTVHSNPLYKERKQYYCKATQASIHEQKKASFPSISDISWSVTF